MSGVVTLETVRDAAELTAMESTPSMVVEPGELAGTGLCVALTATGEVDPVQTAQIAITEYLSA